MEPKQKQYPVVDVTFPVVLYWCESWTVKEAERWRIDAFELWCCRRLLRVPWIARRSNQSVLKEISPEYSIGRTDGKAEAPILWPPDAKNWLIRTQRPQTFSYKLTALTATFRLEFICPVAPLPLWSRDPPLLVSTLSQFSEYQFIYNNRYVQILWHKLLGKQHYIEYYKAKDIAIKIYFKNNSLCNICHISLSGSQLSFV